MNTYVYENEKDRLNTDKGKSALIYTTREAHDLISLAGAATMARIIDAVTKRMGAVETWTVMTAVYYLVEIGLMKETEASGIFVRR